MLAPMILAAAVLAGVPSLPLPAPAPAGDEARQPLPGQAQSGADEVDREAEVVVEARPAENPRPFTIAPDPALERRYTPRERAPLNRITLRF